MAVKDSKRSERLKKTNASSPISLQQLVKALTQKSAKTTESTPLAELPSSNPKDERNLKMRRQIRRKAKSKSVLLKKSRKSAAKQANGSATERRRHIKDKRGLAIDRMRNARRLKRKKEIEARKAVELKKNDEDLASKDGSQESITEMPEMSLDESKGADKKAKKNSGQKEKLEDAREKPKLGNDKIKRPGETPGTSKFVLTKLFESASKLKATQSAVNLLTYGPNYSQTPRHKAFGKFQGRRGIIALTLRQKLRGLIKKDTIEYVKVKHRKASSSKNVRAHDVQGKLVNTPIRALTRNSESPSSRLRSSENISSLARKTLSVGHIRLKRTPVKVKPSEVEGVAGRTRKRITAPEIPYSLPILQRRVRRKTEKLESTKENETKKLEQTPLSCKIPEVQDSVPKRNGRKGIALPTVPSVIAKLEEASKTGDDTTSFNEISEPKSNEVSKPKSNEVSQVSSSSSQNLTSRILTGDNQSDLKIGELKKADGETEESEAAEAKTKSEIPVIEHFVHGQKVPLPEVSTHASVPDAPNEQSLDKVDKIDTKLPAESVIRKPDAEKLAKSSDEPKAKSHQDPKTVADPPVTTTPRNLKKKFKRYERNRQRFVINPSSESEISDLSMSLLDEDSSQQVEVVPNDSVDYANIETLIVEELLKDQENLENRRPIVIDDETSLNNARGEGQIGSEQQAVNAGTKSNESNLANTNFNAPEPENQNSTTIEVNNDIGDDELASDSEIEEIDPLMFNFAPRRNRTKHLKLNKKRKSNARKAYRELVRSKNGDSEVATEAEHAKSTDLQTDDSADLPTELPADAPTSPSPASGTAKTGKNQVKITAFTEVADNVDVREVDRDHHSPRESRIPSQAVPGDNQHSTISATAKITQSAATVDEMAFRIASRVATATTTELPKLFLPLSEGGKSALDAHLEELFVPAYLSEDFQPLSSSSQVTTAGTTNDLQVWASQVGHLPLFRDTTNAIRLSQYSQSRSQNFTRNYSPQLRSVRDINSSGVNIVIPNSSYSVTDKSQSLGDATDLAINSSQNSRKLSSSPIRKLQNTQTPICDHGKLPLHSQNLRSVPRSQELVVLPTVFRVRKPKRKITLIPMQPKKTPRDILEEKYRAMGKKFRGFGV